MTERHRTEAIARPEGSAVVQQTTSEIEASLVRGSGERGVDLRRASGRLYLLVVLLLLLAHPNVGESGIGK